VVCLSVGWLVGLPVCPSVSDTIVSDAKTAEPIDMSFGIWTRVGPKNHALIGVHIIHANGQFCEGKEWPVVKYRDSVP